MERNHFAMLLLRVFVEFWEIGVSVLSLGANSVRYQEGGSVGFGVLPIWIYPVDVCDGLLWVVVYGFYLSNYVESMVDDNKGTYAFSDISDLYLNVMEESVSGPSYQDHDFFWVYLR